MSNYYSEYNSPLGLLLLVANDRHLTHLANKPLTEDENLGEILAKAQASSEHPILRECEKQLDEYFTKKRTRFALPLDPRGTDFQRKAWTELQQIPYGETIAYQTQALRMGNENGSRAVGSANGKNPIPIIIPCHRVVAKNGQLGGFAWGLKAKDFLLNLELTRKPALGFESQGAASLPV